MRICLCTYPTFLASISSFAQCWVASRGHLFCPHVSVWVSFTLMRTSVRDHIICGRHALRAQQRGCVVLQGCCCPSNHSQSMWLISPQRHTHTTAYPSLQSEPRPLPSSSTPPAVINHSVNQIGSRDIYQTPISTHLPSVESGSGLHADLLQTQMFLKWSRLHMCWVRKLF